jgi:UDP-N-acetylmuramoyl-tripeptide--D-alanyl-D-alanine ligase
MKAAIGILKYAAGRKVCVLGDMFELGEHAAALHREVGLFAADEGALVIAVGELAVYYDGAYYFKDKNAFLSQWRNILKPGDTVLIKASNGMAFKEILKGLME